LMIAAGYDIPEVCLYFGGQLLRGCRAVKVSADGFAAFASPNLPPLGTVGIDIEINWPLVRKKSGRMRVDEFAEPVVGSALPLSRWERDELLLPLSPWERVARSAG